MSQIEDVKRDVNVEDCYNALAEVYSADDPIRVKSRGDWIETTVSDLYMDVEAHVEARTIKVSYWAGPGFGSIVEGNLYEMVIDRLAYYHEQRAEALRKRWAVMQKTKGRKWRPGLGATSARRKK